MPAVAPYIPTKQAAFTSWLANFSTLITAAPATYGLQTADAVTIAALNSGWVAAYTPVTSPTTKTAAAVQAKNQEYAIVISQLRAYAQQIAKNVGVTTANKVALGINPQTSTPAPVSAPTTNPVLTFQSGAVGSVILRYRDSAASVAGKGKPYGVTQLFLMGQVSATPITNPALLPALLGTFTKSPFVLSTIGLTSGSAMYATAFWATRKGLRGPLSAVLTFTVP